MAAERRAARAFVLSSLIVLGGCNTVFGPTQPDTNWRLHETRHFSLHVRPQSFADENATMLGAILDDHFDYVSRALGLTYEGRIAAFLYNSRDEADPVAPSNYSGVGFPDTEAMSAVCVPPLDSNLAGLLTHEANHVIMGRGIGRAGTKFMNEGMASAIMSPSHFLVLVTSVHGWARRNQSRLPSMVELADDDKWEDYPEEVSYRSSASFLLYVMEQYGPSAMRQLYTISSGSYERRFAEIIGRSLTDVEADWRRFIETTR